MSNPNHHGDPVRASLAHLLSKASSLPCSAAAQAFSQLVQPTSRFQLALDALLPLLDLDTHAELSQRILVSFILYSLYAPHPLAMNPFKSVLFLAFIKERDQAVKLATAGALSKNEQLVWVLWKILKGDGNDIAPYSPTTLARSPLPPKLRASNLTLDEDYTLESDDLPPLRPTSRDNHKPRLESATPNLDHHPSSSGDPPATTTTSAARDGPYHTPPPPPPPPPQPQPPRTPQASTGEDDAKNESIAQAMKLLLAARDRVLTLSEQRFLIPFIPHLTSPPMITSMDLAPLIAHNPTLAHPLFVSLVISATTSNSHLLLSSSSVSDSHHHHHHHPHSSAYLEVLPYLPPTLPTIDLLGRLLRDHTIVAQGGGSTTAVTVADLVRTEVLGRFIHESINWLDRAESEEREGTISDDRFPKGVQNLCRFYNSLIKLSVVNPSLDADSAEMAHFTLRNARFEEANAVYRLIATSKF